MTDTLKPVRERPIIFSAPMVRAILAGEKTQTRRVINPQPVMHVFSGEPEPAFVGKQVIPGYIAIGTRAANKSMACIRCPYGAPGDELWVRESWAAHWMYNDVPAREARSSHPNDNYWYAADPEGTLGTHGCRPSGRRGRWRSPIHMPRRVSRLTLAIRDVRVQRLQEISEADARAEGLRASPGRTDLRYAGSGTWISRAHPSWDDSLKPSARAEFACGWDMLNGEHAPWPSNPWVWVITFERKGCA